MTKRNVAAIRPGNSQTESQINPQNSHARLSLMPLLLAFASFLFAANLFATTILQLDIDEMLTQAELVFEGKVTRKTSQWNKQRTAIYTLIEFEVQDVIKGEHSATTLQLRFSGGTVDDITMSIAAMNYPEVNEQGIYFVESLGERLVNPLVGWAQGHFIIQTDETDAEKVMTTNAAPVMGFASDTSFSPALTSSAEQHQNHKHLEFSDGTARGLYVGNQDQSRAAAIDKAAFKYVLKQKLLSGSNKN